MARKKGDSINVSMFMALKVSELSNVPVLFMSNPGVGKTTSIEMYAKLRKDESGRPMDVVVLRGNSTSPEEIMGYETCPSNIDTEHVSASVHLRPSWFDRVLKNYDKGIKTLLFLDELTTANEFVQAALLELIFGRKCGMEYLPPVSHCLIVAAGNYMANLSTSMTVISPVLNRFMIYNITPVVGDLDTFLCRYTGAIANEGKVKDSLEQVEKQLGELDKQEVTITEENFNKIGEYIERSVKETTKMLMMSGEKPVDLSVTDLQNIYADVDDNDPNLYGFPTFRTLNYLRDVSIACYKCFGKAGILSDNYRNMIDGLCGIGLKKGDKSNNYEVKKTKIGKEYFDSMVQAVNEIEKMNNTKLSEYVNFFNKFIAGIQDKSKGKGAMTLPEIQALINKISELKADKDISKIERPISPDILSKICEFTKASNTSLCSIKMTSGDKIGESMPVEKFTGFVCAWNTITDLVNSIDNLVSDPSLNYKSSSAQDIKGVVEALKPNGYKLRTMRKIMAGDDAAIVKCVPDIKNLIGEKKDK